MKKRFVVAVLVALLALPTLTGCYINAKVEGNEVGVRMDNDGVSITSIVGAGRYSGGNWFSRMRVIDVSAKTITWEDPDLVTEDKQPVGFALAVTYARMRDSESVRGMWMKYHAEALSDDALQALVLTRIPRAAKAASTQFSLDEMLADRTSIQRAVEEVLASELADAYIELLDVGVSNIQPSAKYLGALEDKAAAQIAVEVAQKRTLELIEQLNQEKAQTEIDLERARRERLVKEELAKIYDLSPEVYELERLRLLSDVIGSNDKIVIVPEGSGLNLFLGGEALPITSD